jgi:hypothetical protein
LAVFQIENIEKIQMPTSERESEGEREGER